MSKMTLRAARHNAGYTQKEAADLIGVTTKTLGKWENGITFPKANKLDMICVVYNVAYDNINFLPNNPLKADLNE